MFGGRRLNALELRRRELVLRSTLNRLAIQMELQNVENALRPAERIVSSVRAVRPWLMILAPLAGILAARGLRGNGSGFAKVMDVLKWIQPLLGLWKQFRAAAEPASETTSRPAADGGVGHRS